jgi:alpha-L-rhamnosidase
VQAQTDRADALETAINDQLRRKDGIYIDGLEPNGAQSKHASQHANAYALSYGIVPADDLRAVAAYTAGLGMQMGPGTVFDLLEGLDVGGRDADLVKILTDKQQPGWAQVLAKGGTFVWETWTPVDVLGDSMSHSRGAIVLAALQENMLGVRVETPGWATFEVEPPTGGIDHASGDVPTPRGTIHVSWSRDPDGGYTVRVRVPVNTTATVRLPGHTEKVGSGVHVVTSGG